MAQAVYTSSGNTASGASGSIIQEGFENQTFPQTPSGLYAGTTYYTYSTTGTGGSIGISTANADSGTRSLHVVGTSGSVNSAIFTLSGGNFCANGGVSFALRYTGTGSYSWGLYNSGGTDYAQAAYTTGSGTGVSLDTTTANIGAGPNFVIGSTSAPYPTTGFRHYGILCSGNNQATFVDYDNSISQTLTAASGTFTPTQFRLNSGGNGAGDFYLDNINFGLFTPAVPETWCSTPTGVSNFGYDFLEDVTRDDEEIGIDIDPFYKFEAQSDDYGFLGKSWGTGVTDATSYFRIEAGTEGFGSVFRSVFSFVAPTGTVAAPIMNKGTGSTAGDTTGDFAEHLEVRFIEGASTWNIVFRSFSASNGQTNIVNLAPAINIDNPNDPHSYAFRVDTANSMLYLYRVSDDDGNFQASDHVATLMSVNFADAGAGWFTGDPIREHWFVGAGDNTLSSSETAVDPDANTNFSTCIYFPAGVAINGDSGSTPSGFGESSTTQPDTTTGQTDGIIDVGNFISVPLFMGFLLVFGIVWMGIQQGAPGAAIGALMFIGTFIAYAIGWIPLWIIMVLFVVSLAAVWFLPKPSKDGM